MVCDICRKEKAVIRIRQMMGDETKELRLCETCAREQGVLGVGKDLQEGIGWLLQGLFEVVTPKTTSGVACPSCGSRFRDIRTKHQVGCAECYRVFTKELRKLLGIKQKDWIYPGRSPKRIETYKVILVDRVNLKTQLEAALQVEDYETAAALRDQLAKLDKETGATR
ncbi:MAG: UvrB/UvrC motif-containing protein [Spirochaetes bacterium]|nr:UvrB/UvrC motif-containing protein [Spirochaetota bacterium]